MSKGSPVYTMRIPDELGERVMACIRNRNRVTAQEPWSFSDFLRTAIEEKLAHMERSRKPKRRRPKEVVYEG